MLSYDEALKKILEESWQKIEKTKRYKPIFKIAMEYIGMWSETEYEWGNKERSSSLTFTLDTGTINCLSLNLYLGENDSMVKDVGQILESLENDSRFKFIESDECLDIGWKNWSFKHRESGEIIMVRGWFENSLKCEKIDTGETKPVYELRCDEV